MRRWLNCWTSTATTKEGLFGPAGAQEYLWLPAQRSSPEDIQKNRKIRSAVLEWLFLCPVPPEAKRGQLVSPGFAWALPAYVRGGAKIFGRRWRPGGFRTTGGPGYLYFGNSGLHRRLRSVALHDDQRRYPRPSDSGSRWRDFDRYE